MVVKAVLGPLLGSEHCCPLCFALGFGRLLCLYFFSETSFQQPVGLFDGFWGFLMMWDLPVPFSPLILPFKNELAEVLP